MARGSARQRKKIAKRLAHQSARTIAPQLEQPIVQIKQVTIEPVKTRIVAPKEELPATKRGATQQKTNYNKKKKLTKKQRKKNRRVRYRGKAQEQYYKENPTKVYTEDVLDLTSEYATEVINDLQRLDPQYRDRLINIFYDNYHKMGDLYIQKLHDNGIIEEIHEVVEYCVARYKGNLPEKYLFKMIEWLNVGLPVDARQLDTEDNEDITSEFYE